MKKYFSVYVEGKWIKCFGKLFVSEFYQDLPLSYIPKYFIDNTLLVSPKLVKLGYKYLE